jgi:hypothetical protein
MLQTNSADYSDTEIGASAEIGAVVRCLDALTCSAVCSTVCFDAEEGELLFAGLANGKLVSYQHKHGSLAKLESTAVAAEVLWSFSLAHELQGITHVATVGLRPSTSVMANTLEGTIVLLRAGFSGGTVHTFQLDHVRRV